MPDAVRTYHPDEGVVDLELEVLEDPDLWSTFLPDPDLGYPNHQAVEPSAESRAA